MTRRRSAKLPTPVPATASARFAPDDAILLENLLAPSRRTRSPLSAQEDLTLAAGLDQVLARVRAQLPAIAADVRQSPERLLAELVAIPALKRPRVLAQRAVFRSPEFFRHLRETALAALPLHPQLAEVLGGVALQLSHASYDIELSRRQLLTAHCIVSALLRLDRRGPEAEPSLRRAAFLLVDPHPLWDVGVPGEAAEDRALYLRTLATWRWEQAQPEEAQALLTHAVLLAPPRSHEWARSQLVLGLLHLIEGVAVRRPLAALAPFQLPHTIDPAYYPLPTLLARLGLALATAQAGDLARAAELRRAAHQLFPLLANDPAALAYPTWLDARIAMATEPETAINSLRIARADLLGFAMPFAATLATVDAVLFLATHDRAGEIPAWLEEAPLPLALSPAVNLCQDLANLPGAPLPRAWSRHSLRREVARLPTLLRRFCRLRGIAVEPLPFV